MLGGQLGANDGLNFTNGANAGVFDASAAIVDDQHH